MRSSNLLTVVSVLSLVGSVAGSASAQELENGVLNHTKDRQAANADATVVLTRDTLDKIILQETKLADAISAGQVEVNGNEAKVEELVSYLDNFEFWFNVATP